MTDRSGAGHTLVVVVHPVQTSFTHAMAAAATRGLERAGRTVTTLDLYAMGFQPAMTEAERHAYHGDEPVVDPLVAESVAAVRAADMLVFVYPTWWSGLPAMLKGWLEKTMVPGLAFVFDATGKVRPGLQSVQSIVGISTYGSARSYVHAVNDNGRRILLRALRLNTGWRTRRTWLPLYRSDRATAEEREAFLVRIEREMAVT
ncbi:MAG: putative oxidoreductase [Ilumatobacteraceae bacterium]|nr:putative oxidoreductase [Ilumatobacteraceae bacterium]MCU1388990.1 putative oxidoreductase [Ilumatobacteraceae bacterium]